MIAWKCPKADYLTVRPWPNAVTHLDCLQPAQPSAFDPKRSLTSGRLIRISGDTFHLHARAGRQTTGTQRAACWVRVREVFLVDFVEGAPFRNVGQEHCALDDVPHAESASS